MNIRKMMLFFVIAFILSYAKADSIRLYMENDTIASTDRDYTHGTRLTYGYQYTNSVPFLIGDVEELEWSLTQLIYTPNPKTIVELQPDERPYAGFLGIGVNAKSLLNKRTQLEEGLTIGVIGPYSYAEQTQKTIHKWLSNSEPKGWNNQLHTEPILNYHYGANYKLVYGNYFDIISKNEVSLGNMFTYGDMGAMFRLGYGLENNFGFNRIEPSVREFNLKKGYVYIFAYPEGRVVLQNIFLDGNTFEDSHSVEKENLVGDFSLGAAAGIGRFEIAYSYVYRSKEFKKQDEHNEFGAVSIAYVF